MSVSARKEGTGINNTKRGISRRLGLGNGHEWKEHLELFVKQRDVLTPEYLGDKSAT